jgi:hypothetical protein
MKKKVDERIINLIAKCQKQKTRGIFFIVGDKGKD